MGPSSSKATSERGDEDHQRDDDLQPDRSLARQVGAPAQALAASWMVCPAAAPAAPKEGFWTQVGIWGCMRVVGQEADKERRRGKAEWAGGGVRARRDGEQKG